MGSLASMQIVIGTKFRRGVPTAPTVRPGTGKTQKRILKNFEFSLAWCRASQNQGNDSLELLAPVGPKKFNRDMGKNLELRVGFPLKVEECAFSLLLSALSTKQSTEKLLRKFCSKRDAYNFNHLFQKNCLHKFRMILSRSWRQAR